MKSYILAKLFIWQNLIYNASLKKPIYKVETNLTMSELKDLGLNISKYSFYKSMSEKCKIPIDVINSNHEHFKYLNSDIIKRDRKFIRAVYGNDVFIKERELLQEAISKTINKYFN